MPEARYIKVILPLRLEWEPCYIADPTVFPDLRIGDRIVVPLAGRKYHGVVSETDAVPEIDSSRIQKAISPDEGLERITEAEIRFWRYLSDYYLVPVGEIYKIAYPSRLIDSEKKNRRQRKIDIDAGKRSALTVVHKRLITAVLEWQGQRKSVLLRSSAPVQVYLELAKRASGTVLILGPEIDPAMEEKLQGAFGESCVVFSSELSLARRRDLAADLRAEKKKVIYGTRQALFLPYSDLSLVIVDSEQDSRLKQESRGPRINARDAAAILASLHGAFFMASSVYPSLESLYNAATGRYALVEETSASSSVPRGYTVINTTEEKPKRGMCGSYSRILLGHISACIANGGHMLFLLPWKDSSELEIEARELFASRGWGKPRMKFANPYKLGREDLGKYALVALLHGEYLSAKDDFRGDEKASQLLQNIASRCADGTFFIQCTSSEGGFFRSSEEILSERKAFGFPPYTRMVDIIISDKSPQRLEARREELSRRVIRNTGARVMSSEDRIRVILPKDKTLASRKEKLRLTVANFCAQFRYSDHIGIDVDPL